VAKLQDSSRDKLESRNAPGFLSRWSRKKQASAENPAADYVDAAQQDADTQVANPPTESLIAIDSEQSLDRDIAAESGLTTTEISEPAPSTDKDAALEENTEEEPLLSDEDMPSLESLEKDSDVSMFFNRGVSRELRKAALRKLFSLPALNITDGLNDYDEDYTTFEPLGDIVTSDMRFHAERKARLAEEAEAEKRAALEEQRSEEETTRTESEDIEEKTTDELGEESETEGDVPADEGGAVESEPSDVEAIHADSSRNAASAGADAENPQHGRDQLTDPQRAHTQQPDSQQTPERS